MRIGKFTRLHIQNTADYAKAFLRLAALSLICGAAGGLVGGAFHLSVEAATHFREKFPWIIGLLPLGGLAIAGLYRLAHMSRDGGTNRIISAVRSEEHGVPFVMAPLIFISTVITHLFGGSAGREGAALQLGGSIGSEVGRIFRADDKDMTMLVLCGMSAVFSALFGTPVTATIFAMEVASVGVIYYAGLVPCLVSALVAYAISLAMGLEPVSFVLANIPPLSLVSVMQICALSVLCALLSILFCAVMHRSHHIAEELISNAFLRIAVGGCVIVALTAILGVTDYNGAGMDIVTSAITEGTAKPEAFLLKMIFTAITIGCGYKGGEIVPTFFIGATFGCTVGGILGLDPGFAAAIGLAALFCGMVNCPVSSVILATELFGSDGIVFFAAACAISYALSGYSGLYSNQKIMYSKLRAEYINRRVK